MALALSRKEVNLDTLPDQEGAFQLWSISCVHTDLLQAVRDSRSHDTAMQLYNVDKTTLIVRVLETLRNSNPN